MDAFSDLLSSVKFQGVIYGLMDCRAPWGVQFPLMPHVRLFIVVRGGCFLQFFDDSQSLPLSLGAGELVLSHSGTACEIKDSPASITLPIEEIAGKRDRDTGLVQVGGDGPLSSILTGCFTLTAHNKNPFFSGLPSIIHLKSENLQAAPGLEATIKLLISELSNNSIGGEIIVNRLSDTLFVQIIRAYILQVAQCPVNPVWLKGLADPQIGAALNLIHANPAAPWTVASLANAVNMSRTAFANKFAALVNYTPIDYLNTWRMQRSIALLENGDYNLVSVGNKVGYSSRSAFAKAFKKEFGQSPGQFKKHLAANKQSTVTKPPTP
jgi:AraC family transcriptional regulator, alkane utilization regulator